MNDDESHLKLLSIFYYVLAAAVALFSSFLRGGTKIEAAALPS